MCMFAQQITVQGVVKDQTGETVIGASVMEKGTTNAVSYTHLIQASA